MCFRNLFFFFVVVVREHSSTHLLLENQIPTTLISFGYISVCVAKTKFEF